ncbi:MAG TPA: hypothetical protein VG265_14045 [Gaiellaceae bacterium]|jgi:hypothetical protein|nr:hypothetical protein [Gaiellaceae bacterium]
MSRRAALYTVSVRGSHGEVPPLGDIDGGGTSLASALAAYLGDLAAASKDGTEKLRSLSVEQVGDEVFAILQHGRNGTAADIVDSAGAVRLQLRPEDVPLVRCGCLFDLPAAATSGQLAVEVNDGRGTKELFDGELSRQFRAQFPGLTLRIERLAEGDVLRDAVESDGIERITLARVDEPGGTRTGGTGKWVGPAEAARVELSVSVAGQRARLVPDLVHRYLAGDEAAFAEIGEFDGLRFDEARVEVTLPDATRRVVDIAHPDTARPVTRALPALELDADGEPTGPSLLSGLRAVLAASNSPRRHGGVHMLEA